ncbi:MAG: hypothetical protein OFPII_03700 [Osedax symbiont Rs1]|nr:MAG: hypothetical protein OFPII_03700 [Osedax symbiont Rs1]
MNVTQKASSVFSARLRKSAIDDGQSEIVSLFSVVRPIFLRFFHPEATEALRYTEEKQQTIVTISAEWRIQFLRPYSFLPVFSSYDRLISGCYF